MSLLDSLGLDDVPSDPNDIPDGPYVGVVLKSEFVHNKKNNSFAHVLTYRVTEGERKGAEKQEWFTLGEVTSTDDKGLPTAITPTMKESQKPWYKKRVVTIGNFTEEEYPEKKKQPELLIGTAVRFGVKTKDGYKNINFVERHTADAANGSATVGAPAGGIGGLI